MLDARTVRGYAAVAAVSLWSVALWTLATPGRVDRNGTLKGTDFVSSWLPGHLVAIGRPDLLYDWDAWRQLFPALFPDVPGLLYLPNYPPQTALVFAPFGVLPFGVAALLWTAVSVLLYGYCIRVLWRRSPYLLRHGATVATCALAWPPFFLLALHAQNTTLVLASYTAAVVAATANRECWMGAAVGLSALKPHFAVVPAMVLLFAGRPRAVAAFAIVVLAQASLAAALLGPHVLADYWHASLRMLADTTPFEPKLWQAHGLKNALDLFFGRGATATGLYLVASVAVLWRVVVMWRRSEGSAALRMTVLVVASALLNPHLYGYDLVVVAPAFVVAANWCVSHVETPEARRLMWLLVALAVAPMLAPLAQATRVQFSVLALGLLWWTLVRVSERMTARP